MQQHQNNREKHAVIGMSSRSNSPSVSSDDGSESNFSFPKDRSDDNGEGCLYDDSFSFLFCFFFKVQSKTGLHILNWNCIIHWQIYIKKFEPSNFFFQQNISNSVVQIITALFNNMQTLKFKAQPTNAFFATVDQNLMFGGSSQLLTMLSELYSTI